MKNHTILTNLTFGGHPVKLKKIDGDIIINCKNVTGLYSQVLAWRKKTLFPLTDYPYGIKTSEPCYIRESILKGHMNIACLDGSDAEIKDILKTCDSMMKDID